MRVLVLSWEYPPVIEGGLARHVQALSAHLADAGDDVHVLTRGDGGLPAHDRHGRVTVDRVRRTPFPLELDPFLRWVAEFNDDLSAGATGRGFDCIHSHDWLVAAAAEELARATGAPWVCTVHATEHGRHQGWVDRHPQSHIHAVERRMARQADRIVTCSEYMRGHVASVLGVSPAKVTAIPNGVEVHALAPGPPDRLRAVRAGVAAGDELLVLLAGRLVHEKGFQLALEALAPVVRRRRDVRFVVAGTGTAEAELRRQARRLGLERAGTFLGWAGDELLGDLYQVSQVCIVPSLYEPFGLVALEAMAAGCPCLAADTGGLREVVPAGLRFPAGDAGALRTALERLLDDADERSRLAAAGREHALGFGWREVAARTRELYAAAARRR